MLNYTDDGTFAALAREPRVVKCFAWEMAGL
jgi:hypothetical protein